MMTVVAFKYRCVFPAIVTSSALPVDVAGLTLWALHLTDFPFAAAFDTAGDHCEKLT